MNVLTGFLFILVVACSAGIELNRLRNYKITALSRHKREDTCGPEYYFGDQHCCKKCSAGTYAKSHCIENYGISNCEPCTKGQDYMDHSNGYSECIRCDICDTVHALEPLSPCTVTKNIQCKCHAAYFCNTTTATSGSCIICQPCTKCDIGIQEQCTETKDSVCKVLLVRNGLWILAPILCVFAVIGLVLIYLCTQKNKERENGNIGTAEGESSPLAVSDQGNANVSLAVSDQGNANVSMENDNIITAEGESNPEGSPLAVSDQGNANVSLCPPELEDIDLRPELQYFADIMNYEETKCFARKMIINTAIVEDMEYGHKYNDIKYELLKAWYQANGMKGAFKKLLDTLVESGRRVTAEHLLANVKERLIKTQANDI